MPESVISFFVSGLPAPQGSKTAFRLPTGRIVLREAGSKTGYNKWKVWRETVSVVALTTAKRDGWSPNETDAIEVHLSYYLPRPKRIAKYKIWHRTKPDSDKLARSCLDSMTGILYKDDSQVARLVVEKSYADGEPGCQITAMILSERRQAP